VLFRRLVRAVLVLAALLALGGALTPPFASAVWSRYQVWEAFPLTPVLGPPDQVPLVARRPAGLDPWGRPWALHLAEVRDDDGTGLDADVRSVGPDGVDDGGNGDDVVVDPTLVLVALAPSFGLLFSLLVLWLVAVVQALAGGRGPALWHDVARAAVAASPWRRRRRWSWPRSAPRARSSGCRWSCRSSSRRSAPRASWPRSPRSAGACGAASGGARARGSGPGSARRRPPSWPAWRRSTARG
jgi:hypothetical protein